jgi:anti-sigma factor RsiW
MTDQPTNPNPLDDDFDESLLSAYLDQELTSDECLFVESRLSENAALRKVFEDLQQVRQWILSNPSESGIPKPIQGEWNRLSGTTVNTVSIATAPTGNAQAYSKVNSETHQSSIDKTSPSSRSWWSLGSLAASLLVLVCGIYLLPSVFRSQSSELAKAVPTKVSPAFAENLQPPQIPTRTPSESSIKSQEQSENLSRQASQIVAPIPKQLAPSPGRAMEAGTNFYSLQDTDVVTLVELPKTTVFIQARRSGQVQLNMQYQQNLDVSDSARMQANTSSSLPPASVSSSAMNQNASELRSRETLRSEGKLALPTIAKGEAKLAIEDRLEATAKDNSTTLMASESASNLNGASPAIGSTQPSTPRPFSGYQVSGDQDIIEAVMPRSQIAVFLNENQLDKLIEDEISPTKPERNAYVQDRLSRQRSGRSVQQYLGNSTQQIAPAELSQKIGNSRLRKNQEMQSAQKDPSDVRSSLDYTQRESTSSARTSDGATGSLSNTPLNVQESTDALKQVETGENDDWVHVVIEVVP